MGPVMFVFDVSDTEPEADAPSLPREVTHPFEVRKGSVGSQLQTTIDNAKRDGVEVTERDAGTQSAGVIQTAARRTTITFMVPRRNGPDRHEIPLRYELLLNRKHSREAMYATLSHELGHLYCGHLGTPTERWWPDRRGLTHIEAEFEAESVCYLVCGRVDIDNPSDDYLSDYLANDRDIPAVSLIEQMGAGSMPLRKEKE
jgi:hypothetical protein